MRGRWEGSFDTCVLLLLTVFFPLLFIGNLSHHGKYLCVCICVYICVCVPFVHSHLPVLPVRLGDELAADGASEEALLYPDQLGHALHGRGQLLPQAEELVPVDGGPLSVHWSDLRRDTVRTWCVCVFVSLFVRMSEFVSEFVCE